MNHFMSRLVEEELDLLAMFQPRFVPGARPAGALLGAATPKLGN